MKNKYVIIDGLAFAEENDMKKLSKYAKEGWVLDSIVGGFFYKLRKDTPQNIIYSLDYRDNADEEYYSIFKEAGWDLVVSVEKKINIFSAAAGTKPIYSDLDTEIEKYTIVRKQTKKGMIYSLIIGILLAVSMIISKNTVKSICLILSGLFIIDIIVFIFNFMPYLAYNDRVKQLKKGDEKMRNSTLNNKSLWKIYMFAGVLYIIPNVWDLIEGDSPSMIFTTLGILCIILSLIKYKEYKKSL